MADKGTGTVFVVDPDQYEGTYERKEWVGSGTIPDPLGQPAPTTLWPATTTTITTWPIVP
jgi:hypothetical protein